jgi:hypothetical protein
MSFPSQPATEPPEFRVLSGHEQKILERMLAANFPGAKELSAQAATALALSIDDNGSLKFACTGNPAESVVRRIPVEAQLDDTDGIPIHLLLHVLDGFLSELEIYREDSAAINHALSPDDFQILVL